MRPRAIVLRSRDTPSPAAVVKTSRTLLDHELMCPREGRQVRAPQTPPDHDMSYEEEDTCMSVICGGGYISQTPPDHDLPYEEEHMYVSHMRRRIHVTDTSGPRSAI